MSDESEIELLRKLRKQDAEIIALLKEKIAQLEQENTLLKQKVDLLVKRIFGAGSEKLDPKQLELLLSGADSGKGCASSEKEEAAASIAPVDAPVRKAPRGERAPRVPEHLPCVDEIIEPEVVQAAPAQWRYIGEEISEQLDYEPAHFLRRRLIRRKYVHRHDLDAVPVIAPLPPVLQERCIAAPGLLAQVIVAKYCDHLPLYRQEAIYGSRYGVAIPRQTMARWMGMAADWLAAIYEHIRAGIVSASYIQMDETPIEYLEPGNGRTRLGYLWVCNRPGGEVVFHWHTSRAAACLEKIIPVNFHGVIQCDAYSAYKSFVQSPSRAGQIDLAGCHSHMRRKFSEAQEQAPRIVGWLLRQISHLYVIEERLRQERAGPALRQAIRVGQSRIVHERLHRALMRLKIRKRYLPQSSMGKAIDYALGQWPALCVYLEDGRVEICNNLIENSIRPTAIGKKNWLFVGDIDAGQRGAILYTIVENCRRRGIDPYAYLRHVLTKLPAMTNRQIKDVTPEAYAKALRHPHLRAAS
jgi:transposase